MNSLAFFNNFSSDVKIKAQFLNIFETGVSKTTLYICFSRKTSIKLVPKIIQKWVKTPFSKTTVGQKYRQNSWKAPGLEETNLIQTR